MRRLTFSPPAVRLALLLLCALTSPTPGAAASAAGPRIRQIAAGEAELTLKIDRGATETLRVLELRPYMRYSADRPTSESYPVAWEGAGDGEAVITIPRFADRRDRLYGKFQLVRAATGEALGAPQYVTDLSGIAARANEIPWPASKKGLTCIVDIEDARALGVKYADEGVVIGALIDWRNPNPEAAWEVDGEKIPINMNYVRQLDEKCRRMTAAGINFTMIPINIVPTRPEPGNPLIHPRTDLARAPMHHGAFNLTDERGLRCYRAAMEFLAERYTRPDRQYGLISGIVVGNELQSHWVWHNMGEATVEQVAEEYTRALRVADLAARRFHRDLRVYASFEHSWMKRGLGNNPKKECRGRELLTLINDMARAEGNFPWHLAFHPYPENLFEPRFWNDRLATRRFDTPKITFKNLEVLPAYLRREEFLYQGRPRHIMLTEQGFHTPDGEEGEKVQAAAFAYAYYKISRMPEIDAFLLHRHVSARDEGGLKLGLWTWDPNGPTGFEPGRKQFIWEVFRQADTPQWEQAFAFALPVIGLGSWDEARPDYTIDTTPAPPREDAVYDLYEHMSEAALENNNCFLPDEVVRAAGWLVPAIFQHPPAEGLGRATYALALPPARPGKRLALTFETMLTHAPADGVRFSVWVDGRQVWAADQLDETPVAHAIDLSLWAGRPIQLTLAVDRRGNPSFDWAHWVQPRIVWEDAPAGSATPPAGATRLKPAA